MAGTGKSTISRTIAKFFAEKRQLGASFFFKRGEGERGKSSRFFTTITLQLVHWMPVLRPHVRRAIDEEHNISEKSLESQFKKLILEPLSKARQASKEILTLIIVIDALDECDEEGHIKTILRLLPQAGKIQSVRMRIFITSRPEFPIHLGFKKMSADAHQDMILEDIPQDTIKHDISIYLMSELTRIKGEFNLYYPNSSLPPDWPGDDTIQTLVAMAVPLFIFAATICRFIGDDEWDWNPNGRLVTILKQPTSQISKLDQTYLPILHHLMIGCPDSEKKELVENFKKIIGSIVVLADPLSVFSLATLLGISEKDVDRRLHRLHSVISIPSDRDVPVRLLHLSFRDFLLDPEKKEKSEFWFWIDGKKTHEMLANRCLELMSQCLRQNMCNLDSPGKLQSEIDEKIVYDCLSQDVQYACQYWIYHLKESGKFIVDQDAVYLFLHDHFLHWLEALSLMGKIPESITLIDTLKSLVKVRFLTAMHLLILGIRPMKAPKLLIFFMMQSCFFYAIEG